MNFDTSNDPRSIDFNYEKYCLEHLTKWVDDALSCEDIKSQDIRDAILKPIQDSIDYHQSELKRKKEIYSLLSTQTDNSYPTYFEPATGQDWIDFWEESYCPKEYKYSIEEELDAMCDAAAEQEERDKCREYNLREAEYYNQRAKLDADYEKSKHYYDTDRNK